MLREKNAKAAIITTPWDQITGKQILEAMETHKHDVVAQLLAEEFDEEGECDDPECSCHDHHHHDHEECCGHDHEGHHHHHHADEVFTSWGMETIVPVTKESLEEVLKQMSQSEDFGQVLRAKGMLPTENPGEWLYFDLVPGQYEIRDGRPDYTGKMCVIGSSLKEEALNQLFGRG